MRFAIIGVALLTLAACSSPEERAQIEEQREIAACTKAGYQPGTVAFDDCKLQLKEEDDQRRADRISALQNNDSFNRAQTLPMNRLSIPLP